MGELNPDHFKYDTHLPTEKWLDVMCANSFIPTTNRPTRVNKNTYTLIENISTSHYGIKYDTYSSYYRYHRQLPVFHISEVHCDNSIDNENKTIRNIYGHRKLKCMETYLTWTRYIWIHCESVKHISQFFLNSLKSHKMSHLRLPLLRIKYRNRLPCLSNGLKSSCPNVPEGQMSLPFIAHLLAETGPWNPRWRDSAQRLLTCNACKHWGDDRNARLECTRKVNGIAVAYLQANAVPQNIKWNESAYRLWSYSISNVRRDGRRLFHIRHYFPLERLWT